MNKCSFYRFILRFIPLMAVKDWAIRHHLEACPHCSHELAEQSEVSSLLLSSEKADTASFLWLKIEESMFKEKMTSLTPQVRFGPEFRARIKLVAGSVAAAIILMVIVSFFLFIRPARQKVSPGSAPPEAGLTIIHFRVKDKPAAPIIYQPYGSNLIFIWAESPNNDFNP